MIFTGDVNLKINANGGENCLFEKVDDTNKNAPIAFFNNAIEIDFEGTLAHKATYPPLQLIFGAKAALLAIPFSTENNINDLYVGLGSPYGTFKYGILSADAKGASADIWSNTGVNALSIYNGSDARFKQAVILESANWNGLTFHFIMGTSGYLTGLTNDLVPVITDIKAQGFGFRYQKNGPFVRYNGLIKQENPSEAAPYTKHRFEIGYEKNNLLLSLGYQTTKSTEGWIDTADMTTLAQKEALKVKIEEANALKKMGGSVILPFFKNDEIIASVAYKIGKIRPKVSWVYGQGGSDNLTFPKNPSIPEEGDKMVIALPNYKQYVIGADYLFNDNLTVSVYSGKITWIYDDGRPEAEQMLDKETAGFGVSYQF